MYLKPIEFDRRLKKINPRVDILRYSKRNEERHHGNCDAIYYLGKLVCAISPHGVYDKTIPEHCDKRGHPHRSLQSLIRKLIAKKVIRNSDKKYLINGE